MGRNQEGVAQTGSARGKGRVEEMASASWSGEGLWLRILFFGDGKGHPRSHLRQEPGKEIGLAHRDLELGWRAGT